MALTPGTRLGVYEITAPLGEGGILPDAFAADPEGRARTGTRGLPGADRLLERAAREAAISARIATLAADFGIKLFERDKRTVTLTPAGEELLAPAAFPLRAPDGQSTV